MLKFKEVDSFQADNGVEVKVFHQVKTKTTKKETGASKLKHEVYDKLSEICSNHEGEDISKEDMQNAINWFMKKFYE